MLFCVSILVVVQAGAGSVRIALLDAYTSEICPKSEFLTFLNIDLMTFKNKLFFGGRLRFFKWFDDPFLKRAVHSNADDILHE